MSVLKSKHMVVAMIVAPILAILAWFAIDQMVGEAPHAAREGASYPLVELPNCRYNSGNCALKNGDFRLDITFEEAGMDRISLHLESAVPLEGVRLAVAEAEGEESRPIEMQASDDVGTGWTAEIHVPNPGTSRIRLVASARQTLYFGDAATNFILPR